jgi:hypothetical protein
MLALTALLQRFSLYAFGKGRRVWANQLRGKNRTLWHIEFDQKVQR